MHHVEPQGPGGQDAGTGRGLGPGAQGAQGALGQIVGRVLGLAPSQNPGAEGPGEPCALEAAAKRRNLLSGPWALEAGDRR